jgi:hypothetical protein
MDYQALLYSPVYNVLAVDATLYMGGLIGNKTFAMIDRTAGITLNQAVDVQTVLPAATVRAPDIIAAGIAIGDLDGKILTLNGKDWRISGVHPNPSPNGEDDGEYYLILEGDSG